MVLIQIAHNAPHCRSPVAKLPEMFEFSKTIQSKNRHFLPCHIVVNTFAFGVFYALKNRGFDVDLKIIAFSLSEGNKTQTHFPAVQIAVNIGIGIGYFVVLKIVAGREADFPLIGQAKTAAQG